MGLDERIDSPLVRIIYNSRKYIGLCLILGSSLFNYGCEAVGEGLSDACGYAERSLKDEKKYTYGEIDKKELNLRRGARAAFDHQSLEKKSVEKE